MTSFGALMTGTFISTGSLFNLSLPFGYDEFNTVNLTQAGSAAANTHVMRAYGASQFPAGYGFYNNKTSGAATIAIESMTTTNGFTFVQNSGAYPLGPAVATTAVTQAAPAVVSTGNTTGLVANSTVVRMYNVAGMNQLSGIDFTVGTVVGSTSFTLAYMDTSNATSFPNAGTTGMYRIVPLPYSYFYPKRKTITDLYGTAGATSGNIIVTFSTTHQYVVGEYLRLVVPNGFGATALNGMLAQITAVGANDRNNFTNTVTLNLTWAATGAAAFAWPSTQTSFTPAQTVDVAETATILTQAEVNNSFTGIQIGTTVQTSGDTYQWFARQGANFGLQTTL